MKIRTSMMTLLATAAIASAGEVPETRKSSVEDTYHGVKVTDDYRWLENDSDPAVRKWSAEENAFARSVLDALPSVDAIRNRVTEIMTAKTVSYSEVSYRGGKLFAVKRQPPKQQGFLVVMASSDEPDTAKVLVDPNAIDPNGTTAIDWYRPTRDGRLSAVSMSHGGSESGDVHVYDTATGKQIHEVVPRVNGGTAGGDLAWSPDGSGFFYTRYPRGHERSAEDMDFYQQLYYHNLGTPTEQDRYELGQEFPRIAEIRLEMDDTSGRLLVTVQNGDGGEFAHYIRSPDGAWMQFSEFGDRTVQATFGPNDDVFIISRKKAPRGRIHHLRIDELKNGLKPGIVPQERDTLVTDFYGAPTMVVTDTLLYVEYQLGGPSEIRVFNHNGERQAGPRQLEVSSVGSVTRLDGDNVLFQNNSYIDAPAWYRYKPKTGVTEKTALAEEPPFDFGDATVVRQFATSRDGSRVPINIILPKGTVLDGSHACIVTGYGGYGISLTPRFRSTLRLALDQGVIYAVANLRGGGEFGERWHHEGRLTKKQNVFDDFAAVLTYLTNSGFTSPQRLAIIGGSNGGLLMGATLVQHPNMMKGVVSYVGIYDMLRVELSPNGAFNIPEFGTVKDPRQFKAMYAYSPYHNVKKNVAYPATLFLTGENDPRVNPMQSRKMTARLQSASTHPERILLRTSSDAGHGGDTSLSERIAQTVDVYAFIFKELGVSYHEVSRSGSENGKKGVD